MKRIPKMTAKLVNKPDDDELGYMGCLLAAGERIYACGGTYQKATILVSNDGGATFTRCATPATSGLRELSLVDGTLYVCGEYGTLAASVDHALTWTPLAIDTQTCLFRLHIASDGTWWVIGDEGNVFRSRDGKAYDRVDTDWDTRLLDITTIEGVTYILGYDGTIRKWTGSSLEALSLDAEQPLTQLLVTRAGTWIAIGDEATLFRSEDAGKTFTKIDVPTDAELEAIVELGAPGGLLVVGSDGCVLWSDDDGKTWARATTDMEGHLWSIAPLAGGVLIGGDDGAIYKLAISETATMTGETDIPEREDDEDDEDDDDEEDDEDEAAKPVTFASIEEASERWKREGKKFIDGLNEYVRKCYTVGPNKAGKEPRETRQDMADYVRERLVELNAAGEHRRARELFPPAYEPFNYNGLGQPIQQAAYLADGRILVRSGDTCYFLGRDKVDEIDDVYAFAQSFDRRFVAKAYSERIDIHRGWDGPVVRTFSKLQYIDKAVLTPEGDAVLVTNDEGVHWISERGVQRLLPEADDASVSYPHAALSPNGRFIAMGTQDTSHIVIDRKTGRRFDLEPSSSYPHYAAFHVDRPEVALSSCHALYGSSSIAVSLDRLLGGHPERAHELDGRAWVYSAASTTKMYMLGDGGGYIWARDFDGEQLWYLFVGSSILALDVSPDGKRLLVGSYAGYVIELDLHASTPEPMLLTNAPVKELARWALWRGHEPLIW